jgi:hypothetical protein
MRPGATVSCGIVFSMTTGVTDVTELGRVAAVGVLVVLLASSVPAQGRRVVDVVTVGDAASEREHEYAAQEVVEGRVEGRTFRQARGWMRYSLAIYEDTEVTLACTFRGSEGRPLTFDLVVEGRKITPTAFASPGAAPATAAYTIPFAITKGKTVISVTLAARGGPTPGLIELRTVQEHLEGPLSRVPTPASLQHGGTAP